MKKRITHPTALPGRLFLCLEIAVHHARPPPVSVKTINQPSKGGQLMYYHTCPYCGANLDPDEHCDCLSRIRGKSPKWNSMDGVRAWGYKRVGRART